jgi:cephalosporin-C deacetylase-like acetyl esterase
MPVPDDFGLSPAQTLSHVASAVAAPGFFQFWTRWADEVWAESPTLRPLPPADPADLRASGGAPGVTHTIPSTRSCTIGCRLSLPVGGRAAVRAVAIVTHGYDLAPGEPLTDDAAEAFLALGVATLQLRVRGYPGSQFDSRDLTVHPTGFITHGLESLDTWILPLAVADVVNACRAARSYLGPATPYFLVGESFGAGLAVLAAAQLASTPAIPGVNASPERLAARAPARLVLGLPSLGDWSFRLRADVQARAVRGINRQIADFLTLHRRSEDDIRHALNLCDSAVHARRVACPVLCKLAEHDDVVPAPAAAAVYNALGTDPSRKWRFITPAGHADVGLANARRHAMFDRLAAEFLDPAKSPDFSLDETIRMQRAG